MTHRRSRDVIPLILYHVDDEYRETHPDILKKANRTKKAWIGAAKVAGHNELLYYFYQKAIDNERVFSSEPIRKYVLREKEKQKRFRKTLRFAKSVFDDERLEYMFIKLYRGIPYTPRDVDVLVKKDQNERVISAYKKRNAVINTFDDAEVNCEIEGLLKVDLYNGFCYFSRSFLDEDFLWRKPRKIRISGVDCSIPSREADFASLLIHSLLAHRYLSLLDFLYAKSLYFDRRLNLREIEQQAGKHEWAYAYSKMIGTVEDIYERLYMTDQLVDFPIAFTPRFTLGLFRLEWKRKLTFVASSVIDRALLEYNTLQGPIEIDMPARFGNFALKVIRKVKYWVGDRKGIEANKERPEQRTS